MRRFWMLTMMVLAACRIERAESGRPPGTPTEADSLARVEQDSAATAEVEAVIRVYYERVSARDWRGMRRGFYNGGTVTTRWTPPAERSPRVSVQPVDEYARRAPDGVGKLAVFSERPVHMHVTAYGDLADAWVVYEGRLGAKRDSVQTVRGVDAFHLYRDDGSWRIVDLAFTTEQPARPLVPPKKPARRAAATSSKASR